MISMCWISKVRRYVYLKIVNGLVSYLLLYIDDILIVAK
jgi:hypothetical protein